MLCPLQQTLLKKKCNVQSCMYFSLLKGDCGYVDLHGTTDITVVAEHKNLTVKEATTILKKTQKKVKYIVVLDEYLNWVHERYKHVVCKQQNEELLRTLVKDSVICQLPNTVYLSLLPHLVNQDVLDEFVQQKQIDDMAVEDLLFDINVQEVRNTFC